MYHYVAHDPLLRRHFGDSMDSPRLRYRRILLPALAFLFAGGRDSNIDASFVASNLLFLFLGAWWLGRYLVWHGRSPMLAILFVLTPAALTSLDRLTVDLSLAALCVGVAYYAKLESQGPLYTVLVLACLSRETGVALAIAFCISMLTQRRYLKAVLYATAMLPAAVWYLFLNSRTPAIVFEGDLIPFYGIFSAMVEPFPYQFSPVVNAVVTALDDLALAGIVMAGVLALYSLSRNRFGPIEIAASIWAVVALCLPQGFYEDCYSGGRVFTPLLIFVAMRAATNFSPIWVLPLLLLSMRSLAAMVLASAGHLRGLFSRH